MAKTTGQKNIKLSPAQVAKMRRDGATWARVSEAAGKVKTSTGWGQYLAAAGYDRLGRKGGKGKSKARAHGPSLLG
jgi:hypothetical protein